MKRLQNLVALSAAVQCSHDDAVAAGDTEAAIELRYADVTIARHISRHVKATRAGESKTAEERTS